MLEISRGLLALRVGGNDVVGPGFEHDGHDQKASKHDVGYDENAMVRLYSNQALVSVQGKNLIYMGLSQKWKFSGMECMAWLAGSWQAYFYAFKLWQKTKLEPAIGKQKAYAFFLRPQKLWLHNAVDIARTRIVPGLDVKKMQ